MTILNFFILGIFLFASVYLSFLNPVDVSLHLTRHLAIRLPLIILILSSTLVGVILTSFIVMYKDFGGLLKSFVKRRKEKKNKHVEELFERGYSLYLGGKKRQAAGIFKKVIDRKPTHEHTLLLLGDIKREEGNYTDAINYHLKGKKVNPHNPDILYSLVEDYNACDKWTESLAISQEIRDIDRRSPKPFEKMKSIYVKMGEWKRAIESQKELLSLLKGTDREEKAKKQLASLYYQSGIAHINKVESDAGIDELNSAIKTDPNFVPAYITLGKTYLSLERPKDAVQTWEKGYKATKSFVIIRRLVDLYQQSDDDAAAFDAYKWAISVNPDAAYLHLMLGEFYVRKSRAEEGIMELESARKGLSSQSSLHLIMAMGYEIMDKKKESIKEYHLAFKAGTKDLITYVCSACSHSQRAWNDRCPSCGELNSFKDHGP